jgi:hypothetical protein
VKRVVAVLLGMLVLLLLVFPVLAAANGAAAGDAAADPCASAPSAGTAMDDTVPCPTNPTAPVAYAGGVKGCVSDPSGTGGCISPALAHLMAQVEAAFGRLPVSCWSARNGDPYSDHPKGRACDYTFGRIGTYPGPADTAHGWQLAHWLRTYAAPLHVDYVIWQGRIWSSRRDAEGWRSYTGGSHYPSTGPTFSHHDHVHVSVVTNHRKLQQM